MPILIFVHDPHKNLNKCVSRRVSFDIKITRQGSENACCIIEAKPGKLDIKRCEPGILFISLQVGSLFKLVIMI